MDELKELHHQTFDRHGVALPVMPSSIGQDNRADDSGSRSQTELHHRTCDGDFRVVQ